MCAEAHGNQKTNEYQDDHICSRLKALIDGAVPWVQDIWVAYFHMEILGFYTHGRKTAFNEINHIGIFWTVRNLWSSVACFFNCYCHWL